jgi:hypothetical protein
MDASWLEARDRTKSQGGLPPNRLHDNVLYLGGWKSLGIQGYEIGWAREVLVYPRADSKFSKQDIIDDFADYTGRRLVFPASCIPQEAFGEKAGLFVDPSEVEVSSWRIVVLAKPESITIQHPFLQRSGLGMVDERTGIPLDIPFKEKLKDILADQLRFLLRSAGQSVRPIARYYGDIRTRKDIDASRRHDDRLGVGRAERIA